MPAPAPTNRVRDVIEPVVTGAGLHLEELEVTRVGARTVVSVVLDLHEDETGGLSLDRIADVTRDISAALDDVIPGESTLEVSSPGVSRPLTQRRHFARARGRLVTVHLRDGEPVTGRLVSVEGEGPATVLHVVPEPVSVKGRKPVAAPPQDITLDRVRSAHVEVELAHLDRGTDAEVFGDDVDDDPTTGTDLDDFDDTDGSGTDAADTDAGAPATEES